MDGVRPFMIEMMDELLMMEARPLIWGFTYKFIVIWPQSEYNTESEVRVLQQPCKLHWWARKPKFVLCMFLHGNYIQNLKLRGNVDPKML